MDAIGKGVARRGAGGFGMTVLGYDVYWDDAFEQEPPADKGWFSLDNVVLGSHAAASTVGATERMGRMAAENLLRDLGLPEAL